MSLLTSSAPGEVGEHTVTSGAGGTFTVAAAGCCVLVAFTVPLAKMVHTATDLGAGSAAQAWIYTPS